METWQPSFNFALSQGVHCFYQYGNLACRITIMIKNRRAPPFFYFKVFVQKLNYQIACKRVKLCALSSYVECRSDAGKQLLAWRPRGIRASLVRNVVGHGLLAVAAGGQVQGCLKGEQPEEWEQHA